MKKKLINLVTITALVATAALVVHYFGSRALDFVIKMHSS